jgi:hypothetical protein
MFGRVGRISDLGSLALRGVSAQSQSQQIIRPKGGETRTAPSHHVWDFLKIEQKVKLEISEEGPQPGEMGEIKAPPLSS